MAVLQYDDSHGSKFVRHPSRQSQEGVGRLSLQTKTAQDIWIRIVRSMIEYKLKDCSVKVVAYLWKPGGLEG